MALRAFQSNPSIGGFGGESVSHPFASSSGIPTRSNKSKSSRFGNGVKQQQRSTSRSEAEAAAGRNGCNDGSDDDHVASKTTKRQKRQIASSLSSSQTNDNAGQQFGVNNTNSGSCCDAFAQIVKELVDNAVDACSSSSSSSASVVENNKKRKDENEKRHYGEDTTKMMMTNNLKRVRVCITSVATPVPMARLATTTTTNDATNNDDTNNGDDTNATTTTTMDCLRIEISDNGCGMENIDECVTAFRSNKTGSKEEEATSAISKTKKKASGNKKKSSSNNNTANSSNINNENYTSGRYGVGLTLCLLHAQRLCPGTGACITSATTNAKQWTRATYEVDTNADDIVCKKKELFEKDVVGECGTTVSLLVPGGEDARRAWPRLAEYFARFQLSINLPCSLEVKAPTLQSRPVYVRPPAEVERRRRRKRNNNATTTAMPLLATTATTTIDNKNNNNLSILMDEINDDADDKSNDGPSSNNKGNWEGGDGFDECNSPEMTTDDNDRNNNCHSRPQEQTKTSKAARRRAEAELQRRMKTHLICKAASAYKGRPGLKVENVAYTTQPIRRNTTTGSSSSSGRQSTTAAAATAASSENNNGPVLEIGFVVFGPEPEDHVGNDDDDDENNDYGDEHYYETTNNPRNSNANNHHSNNENKMNSAKLQVVRMVNGIPLLDSSEALACGVVQKIANNAATWNSFGLTVLQNSQNNGGSSSNERNNNNTTPTFEINDSPQVAPFLKSSTHSLFQVRNREFGQTSSDEDDNDDDDNDDDGDDFDIENRRAKRKKDRRVRSILPARQRLGDVLMIVQIQAKPSALPLPTLSKGRLPLNDKGISDALENGISDCLRCLQKSSPGLLLTAYQLKRVERDVRYVPSIAGAIASVLCRSKQRNVYDNAMKVTSGWDDQVKRMGVSCSGNELETVQRRRRIKSSTPAKNSDTIMNAQAYEERSRVDVLCPILERRLRFVISDEFRDAKKSEEKEVQRKEREEIAAAKKRMKKSKIAVEEPDGMKSDCFESDGDDSIGHSSVAESVRDRIPIMKSSHDDFDSDVSSPVMHSRRRRCRGDSVNSSEKSIVTSFRGDPQELPRDDFDSDMSSPVQEPMHIRGKVRAIESMQSNDIGSRGGPKKPSNDDGDFDSDISSPAVYTGCHSGKQNRADSIDSPKSDGSTRKTSWSSPAVYTGCHSGKYNRADTIDSPKSDGSTRKTSWSNSKSDTSSPVAYTRHHHWKGKPTDEFDDGYESSPRLSAGRLEDERNASNARGRNDGAVCGSASNAECQHDGSRSSSIHSPDRSTQHDSTIDGRDESSPRLHIGRLGDERGRGVLRCGNPSNVRYTHSPDRSAKHDDAMSSDSDWSSQYGEVVSGHVFR